MAKEKNVASDELDENQESFIQEMEVESLDALVKLQSAPKNVETNEEDEEIEETEEEIEDNEVEENSTEESENSSESAIKVFAQMLGESGIIDFKEDEFEDEDEYLVNKYVEGVNKKAQELIEEIVPEDLKELFNNYQKGVPLDELIKSESTKIRLDNIKIEDLEEDDSTQEKLIRQSLEYQGFDKEEIDEKIEDYKDGNLMFKESKSAIKIIKKQEDRKIQELQKQQEQEDNSRKAEAVQMVKQLRSNIFEKEEIIPGIKMSKEDKEQFYKGIVEVGKDGLTQLQKKAQADPDWEMKSAYFLLMMDGKLDKVVKKNKTEVTQKFKENADKQKSTSKFGKVDMKTIERAFSNF